MQQFPFFFNDTATTEIYTLSLHDALPISSGEKQSGKIAARALGVRMLGAEHRIIGRAAMRSEEHTSELQSQANLVCRLLLEKKKTCFRPREFVHLERLLNAWVRCLL